MKVKMPTDDLLMATLCCGGKCEHPEQCHRHDFVLECDRVKRLLAEATISEPTINTDHIYYD